jgi:hypothetical protein
MVALGHDVALALYIVVCDAIRAARPLTERDGGVIPIRRFACLAPVSA